MSDDIEDKKMTSNYDAWLGMQYDLWMEREPEKEKMKKEYFFQESNCESIYILGEGEADYEVWFEGKKYDDGLTLAQALDTANTLYDLFQPD